MGARVFSATTELAARFFPWQQAPLQLLADGPAYLGAQLGTGRIAFFGPHALLADQAIRNGNVDIYAPTGHGKDVLAKSLSILLGAGQAGFRDKDRKIYEVPRSRAHDYKTEKGLGEWSGVGSFYRVDIQSLIKRVREHPINIFMRPDHVGATPIDNARLCALVLEEDKGSPLTGDELLAIQVAVHSLMKFAGVVLSMELIAGTADTLRREVVSEYLRTGLPRLRSFYAEQLAADDKFAAFFNLNIDVEPSMTASDERFERFQSACSDVARLARKFLRSPLYGGVFGGDENAGDPVDVYDLMSAQFAHIDWDGVPVSAAIILEKVFRFWENVGSRNEGGNPAIVPHFLWVDEQGSRLQDGALAMLDAEGARTIRSRHTVRVHIQQYLTDKISLGDASSALRSHGQTMYRSTGAVFTGQVTTDEERHALTQLGAIDKEADFCSNLGVGQWGFLAVGKGRPMEFFQHHMLPEIEALLDTTSAVRRAADRVPVTQSSIFNERVAAMQGKVAGLPEGDVA